MFITSSSFVIAIFKQWGINWFLKKIVNLLLTLDLILIWSSYGIFLYFLCFSTFFHCPVPG